MRPTRTDVLALSLLWLSVSCATSDAAPVAAAPERVVPATSGSVDAGDTRLLAAPAVSAEHVAFAYAGDLWVASRSGGRAWRVTTHPGAEGRPRFSPDGSWIAFSGQYDGNADVYLVPTLGGEPRRLTWHPGTDLPHGFTPDGQAVLFTSGREVHTRRHHQLFTVPVDGGHPSKLPIPHVNEASMSADGSRIAYTPLREAFHQWKNYRGGTASRIWIYDVADHSVVEVPQPEGRSNDHEPMWLDGRLHFLSDRDGEFNLYAFDEAGGAVERLTAHEDFPVISASSGAGAVVYEQAGWIHLYEPGAGSTRLTIGAASELVETRPRYVSGTQYLRSGGLSPSGSRAVVGFRGEIVTVPAEDGDPRNLTRTPGVHEREPVWSPDGKSIAYFSDASGEYELHVAPQNGGGEVRTYSLGGTGFYDSARWSPDSKKICFIDNSWTYRVIDLESGEVARIDSEPLYGPLRSMSHSWSPDSRWIAYTRSTRNYFKELCLYEVEAATSHTITSGLGDVSSPVFDADGKHLWFAASTDAGPARTWFAMSNADMRVSNSLYVAVLSDEHPSPFAPRSDEEEAAEEEGQDDSEEDGAEEATDEAEDETEAEEAEEAEDAIDVVLEGLEQRIVAVPLPSAFYWNLAPGREGQVLYLTSDEARAFGSFGGALARFELESREATELADGVVGFAVTPDGGKLLVGHRSGSWQIADNGGPLGAGGALDLGSVQVKIEPRTEWAQIFDEAWRINRDYFYDPGMHGADWPAIRERYAQYLPHLATRSDLNRLIQWMCSELAVGHHNVGGGDYLHRPDGVPGGLLGADYEIAEGRYRFARIFGGLNWNPDLRAPLTEPGVGVVAGEFLLAVDGVDLAPPENLYSRFENSSGRQVELTVGPNADGTDSRTVTVVPVRSEAALRNRAWVESNLARVTEATDGRVAYVYVPDTAGGGHEYFKRYFFPQADRQAIIVDERHNSGGQIADYVIDILRRPHISDWAMRYGADLETPQGAIHGPKVMLIDETAGSGGDMLPWMFRKLELGTLVGRPTWGGLVGIMGFPTLMDGGSVTAPNVAIWTEDGFIVENVGVPPDVEVEQLPALMQDGRDPQLEAAIELVLQQLENDPPVERERPPFPIRVRR